MYEYRPLTDAELVALWDAHVAAHPGEAEWEAWRERFLRENRRGQALSFAVLSQGTPVGEGTLLLSPDCGAIRGRRALADGKTVANINALRIAPAYEGKGHISLLVRAVEAAARERGYTALTIGVAKNETRTRDIYHHFGYTALLFCEHEGEDEVLYFSKSLV